MKVTRVALSNFLSYNTALVTFGSGINIITGENASGKTNLIDSIYYCSLGRSSRQNKDKELINWQSAVGARVTINVEKKFSKHEIDIYIDSLGKKRILVDKLPLQRIGELMGIVNIVFFSPSEIKLVREAPSDRRRFIDISLCQQSKTYFYTLQRYNSLLVQRNKLLKSYKGRPALNEMLPVVDADLIRNATFIIQERAKFIAKLTPIAAKEHSKLTEGKEELSIFYETEAVDFNNISGSLKALMQESRASDERMEYTTIGPHRDDIKISASGVDLRKFGSQGQQRSAVLSLKLAEIALFKDRTGESPILLLDDVLSELDFNRQRALFNALGGIQTIVTCTDFTKELAENYKSYIIKERTVQEV